MHHDTARLGLTDWSLVGGVLFAFVFGLSVLDPLVMVFAGLAFLLLMAATHRRYELYDDRLVIVYWAPRRRSIPRAAIVSATRVKMPLKPESLLLERTNRRDLAITPSDPEAFAAHFPQPAKASNPARPTPSTRTKSTPRPNRRRRKR